MQGPFGACPSCGGPVGATARFCGSCGRQIAAQPAAPPPVAPPPVAPPLAAPPARRSSGAKIVAITAVAAVALLAIGVGAGLLLRPNAGGTGGTGGPGSSTGPTASGGDQAIPSFALATAPIVGGHADESGLVAPILEEGDVPPAEDPTPPVTGHLALGTAASLASQTIGAAGGTIEASGLRLEFPPGALAADTQVSVTQAPVESADFGDHFTPLTPLYTIDTGDAVLAAPVIVTLPATVPGGAMALAFYYDDAAGTLTPLAPIDADATSITAGAIHFSGIVAGVFRDAATTVDSGFRPGIDDWQFANRGSYVAPRGHCEGQSDTAIWYYVVKHRKDGASPLYGLYDNNAAPERTPTFQWDDSDGYRLASNVQGDPAADPSHYWATTNRLYGRPDDRMTYAAFRAAIAFTGEPQEITISTGAKPQHAMIVYRVTADRLFIADPNYPGRLRTIRYDAATGKLAPYASGANAADIAANGAKIYTKFGYVPWRSAASEAALAAHWAEFEDNTAGDAVFPRYELEALAGLDETGTEIWVPLVDGYTSQEKQLKIRLRDPANANDVAIKVFPGTSSTPLGPFRAEQTIDLKEGDTPLGIEIDFSTPTDTKWRYVDFVRVTVTSGPPTKGEWVLTASAGRTVHPNDPEASLSGYAFELRDQLIRVTHWEPAPDSEGNATGSRVTGKSTVIWNFLPDRAVPGDTWQTTLSVEPGCEPFTPFRIKVSAATGDSPPENGVDVAYLEQELCKLSETKGSFTFPAVSDPRSPPSSLQIHFSVELPGVNAGEWAYTYTWQP